MTNALEKLLAIAQRLAAKRIWHQLSYYRDDAVSIEVVVPGQRWEIDVLQNGEVEVEVFKSDGRIFPEEKIEELFQRFSD